MPLVAGLPPVIARTLSFHLYQVETGEAFALLECIAPKTAWMIMYLRIAW
jgi:hypothetical protein